MTLVRGPLRLRHNAFEQDPFDSLFGVILQCKPRRTDLKFGVFPIFTDALFSLELSTPKNRRIHSARTSSAVPWEKMQGALVHWFSSRVDFFLSNTGKQDMGVNE